MPEVRFCCWQHLIAVIKGCFLSYIVTKILALLSLSSALVTAVGIQHQPFYSVALSNEGSQSFQHTSSFSWSIGGAFPDYTCMIGLEH